MRFGVLAMLSVLAIEPTDAHACSCTGNPVLFPRSGSTAVPTDAIIVIGESVDPKSEVTLRDGATGAPVPLQLDQRARWFPSGAWFVGRPSRLRADHDYVITVVEGFYPPVHSTFRTGNFVADTPMPFGGIESFSPEVVAPPELCSNSCFSGELFSRLRLAYEPVPETIAYLELQIVRADDRTVVDTIPLSRSTFIGLLESGSCGLVPPIWDVHLPYCARLVAFDIAGNAAGGERELCAGVTTCETVIEGGCEIAKLCKPVFDVPESSSGCATIRSGGWLAIVVVLVVFRRRRQ